MFNQKLFISFISLRYFILSHTYNLICKEIDILGDKNELTIKVGKKRHNGTYISDITRVNVVWKRSLNETMNLKRFNEVFDLYNPNQVMLLVKMEEKWESYKSNGELIHFSGTGSFRWNIPRIPCLSYDYQVVIPSNDKNATACFGTELVTLQKSSSTDVRRANYRPKPPTDLDIISGKTLANVRWNTTRCSEEYVVLCYESTSDRKLIYNQTVNAIKQNLNYQSTEISNLKSCTEYRVEVFAKLKSTTMDYNNISLYNFYTKPEFNVFLRTNTTTSIYYNNLALVD